MDEDVATVLLTLYASNNLNVRKKRKRKIWVKPLLDKKGYEKYVSTCGGTEILR